MTFKFQIQACEFRSVGRELFISPPYVVSYIGSAEQLLKLFWTVLDRSDRSVLILEEAQASILWLSKTRCLNLKVPTVCPICFTGACGELFILVP